MKELRKLFKTVIIVITPIVRFNRFAFKLIVQANYCLTNNESEG